MRVVDHDTVSIGRHADPREGLFVGDSIGRRGGEGGRRRYQRWATSRDGVQKDDVVKSEGDAGDAVARRGGRGKEERSEAGVRGENE